MNEEEISRTRSELDEIVNLASERMTREIRHAMAQGELEFKDMAERIAMDMGKLVLKQILAGMQTQNLGQQANQSSATSSDQLAQMLTSFIQKGSRYS